MLKLYLLFIVGMMLSSTAGQNLLDYIDSPTVTGSAGPEATNVSFDENGIRVYATATGVKYYASAANPVGTSSTKTVTVTTSELPIRIMYGSADSVVTKGATAVMASFMVSAVFFLFA